jgi:hypothetical protein
MWRIPGPRDITLTLSKHSKMFPCKLLCMLSLHTNEHPTNLQEAICICKRPRKVCTIDDCSPSKYDPCVPFNYFPNRPRTLKIKKENINIKQSVLPGYQDRKWNLCKAFLKNVTKIPHLPKHNAQFLLQLLCEELTVHLLEGTTGNIIYGNMQPLLLRIYGGKQLCIISGWIWYR